MNQRFGGWQAVADRLRKYASDQAALAKEQGDASTRLNHGQRASLHAVAERISHNGLIIADEVGMGKTRIAVEVVRAVAECGGRVVIVVPPGLGYQWQAELREGHVVSPPVLRSLWSYLEAWYSIDPNDIDYQEPWFSRNVVLISHAFVNWRLGERTEAWRWALLPEVYARWRAKHRNRVPRNYHGNNILSDEWVSNAAGSIVDAIAANENHRAGQYLDSLLGEIDWNETLVASGYSKNGTLREWLERVIGLGLGLFDMLIIDEAHKARGVESGLSRLVNNVITLSHSARRLALTATPVELDVTQWRQTLGRIGLSEADAKVIDASTAEYATAVARVRKSWRSSEEARQNYRSAAEKFQRSLSPYLLRRDKREDPDVQMFSKESGLQINDYRHEREISIGFADLTIEWRRAVCAAEALSVVVKLRQADSSSIESDRLVQRLRLTLANGHGIAALLDRAKHGDMHDEQQEEGNEPAPAFSETVSSSKLLQDGKRQQRAKWWMEVVEAAFDRSNTLFDHPAICASVKVIEEAAAAGEKVLVFGKFIRPLRALVDLLNAREMLRCLGSGRPWPQAKVHGEQSGDAINNEWPAVRAALRQLGEEYGIAESEIDERLSAQYDRNRRQRNSRQENLVSLIEKDLRSQPRGHRTEAVFAAFKRAADCRLESETAEQHPFAMMRRALDEASGDPGEAFAELVDAVADRNDEDHSEVLGEEAADRIWEKMAEHLHEEYNRTQGGFARLMHGGTSHASRRMIQLAFNRSGSVPKVLAAQSTVGREGLNLHKACRIVVLLHPEWNPGVVEQQIGRIDRVGSHWSKQLHAAISQGTPKEKLPRMEIRPVIFRGTYDEHNWEVLRARWDDLRAQLHGEILPQRLDEDDPESHALAQGISDAAPNFSPLHQHTLSSTNN